MLLISICFNFLWHYIILIYLYVFISLSLQNAQLGEKMDETKLEVFPFAKAQHLNNIGFIWKREKGTENELKVTAEKGTVCYGCEVSKNGIKYFTSYHFLKGCKF